MKWQVVLIQSTMLGLTFKHLNSHCGRFRPPLKSYCCSLGNLTKSTFTNDFLDGHVTSLNFPGAC